MSGLTIDFLCRAGAFKRELFELMNKYHLHIETPGGEVVLVSDVGTPEEVELENV